MQQFQVKSKDRKNAYNIGGKENMSYTHLKQIS